MLEVRDLGAFVYLGGAVLVGIAYLFTLSGQL